MKKRLIRLVFLFALSAACGGVTAQQTALDRYIAKPDADFAFAQYATDNDFFYKTYFLTMTSQRWRTAAEVNRTLWNHEVSITLPRVRFARSPETAVLLIDGGGNDDKSPDQTYDALAVMATTLGVVVASVGQIPNQPLYFSDEDNRKRTEDEILAYSLDKYLDTDDEEWPVHLAMTKATVRAMDTVQKFLRSKENLDIENFIVIGVSKRGWTTWLTAAVDSRVTAIAPVSIDMLNLDEQLRRHWGAYGFYAPALEDYVEFDIPCRVQAPAGQRLLKIIDPYEYRTRYTMPKLVANSTGDQFFLPDSSNFYYADLPDPKLLRYTPNTDHGQKDDVIFSALSWIDDVLDGKTNPRHSWTLEGDGSIRVQSTTRPSRVRLWQASNQNARDFRLEAIGSAWTSIDLQDLGGRVYRGFVPPPGKGWTAFTVEMTYDSPGVLEPEQVFSTDVRVTPETLPFARSECSVASKRWSRLGLYDPSTGQFSFRKANTAGPPDIQFVFSSPRSAWRPVIGDWNHNGFDTMGLYRPDLAIFELRNFNEDGAPEMRFRYGPRGAGWQPVAGDWDGDGVDTIGLFEPKVAAFHLRNSNTMGMADIRVRLESSGRGSIPVVGDWDGDGIDTVGLYKPETSTFQLRNSNTASPNDIVFRYGQSDAGWLPVVGDWNGDGIDTVGLYRPSSGSYLLRNSNTPGAADIRFDFGKPGNASLPIAGHWQ
jgi:PhoPQ-activated pathogenicity-related protein